MEKRGISTIVGLSLRICGIYVTVLGLALFVLMFASIYQPEFMLNLLIGKMRIPFKSVAGSSWAQVAVAFGMHR